uniref:TGF_BETA_2 domain-containing protein n=1 Tax=Syphacia muris TaxID=451379 RepID=A0A0N5AZP9_9BILA
MIHEKKDRARLEHFSNIRPAFRGSSALFSMYTKHSKAANSTTQKGIYIIKRIENVAYAFPHRRRQQNYSKITLNVDDVSRWIQNENNSYVRLLIKAKSNSTVQEIHSGGDGVGVLLEIITVDQASRRKRETQHQICEMNNKQIKTCCRYDLIIDFHSSGWDFIQFPPSYNAYMCVGDCNPKHPSRNAYGMLAAQKNESVVSCCHPGEYEDLDIVYFSETNILKHTKV